MHTMQWTQVAPGVWRGIAGEREPYTLLDAAASTPNREALAALPAARFPFEQGEVRWERHGAKTALRLPLATPEDIYGLGLDFNRLRRNKTVLTLHMDAWGGQTGRTHAPVPFYVSSRGYGVLVNSARYLTFYVGTAVRVDTERKPPLYDRNTDRRWQAVPDSDTIEVSVPAAGVEVYVFAGPTPLDAVRRYNLFCGGGCLPPKWGLGFTHRTPAKYTAEQVTREAAEFEARGFPLDFVGLEPGWQDHAYPCSFTWDKGRFPDPKGFVNGLYQKGVRVSLWFNPYVSPTTTTLYDKLLPYAGTHTVWNGIVPDYTLAEPRLVFGDHLDREILSLGPGAGGFKIDEVDGHDQWLWPDTAGFPSGRDAEQLRQTYAVLLQRLTEDRFRAAGRRTYGLARGSNAGAARFPYVIYSDAYDFDGYLTACASSGFLGVLWTPEVRGAKSPEEWVRRIQAVCLSPMAMLNAWADGTKPWTYPEAEKPVKDAMLLRLRLLPYLYTAFAEYHYRGTPPVRPMPLVPGFAAPAPETKGRLDATANPYEAPPPAPDASDQFLLGDSLLAAPIRPGQKTRSVALPPGRWFDFYTGALAGQGSVITVTPDLNHIPLFVRDGGIIPLIPERLHTPRPGETPPLEVRHYGDAPGEMRLYDDDGETFAYEKGVYSWTILHAHRDAAGQWQGDVVRDGNGKPFHYGEISWRFMTE